MKLTISLHWRQWYISCGSWTLLVICDSYEHQPPINAVENTQMNQCCLVKKLQFFFINTDIELRSSVAGRWTPRTSRSQATPKGTADGRTSERVKIFVWKKSFRCEHLTLNGYTMLLCAQATLLKGGNLCYFPSHIPRFERIRGRQACQVWRECQR